MRFFTVIVPVYNVEFYLKECLDSILSQTYRDYELILVNDGSTDRSGEICDEYALSDNRIKVLHKANGGLSDARNWGLKIAQGEYIIFVDSDDFIEITAFEKFHRVLNTSEKPDVLITLLKQIYDNSETRYMDKNMPLELMQGGNKGDIVTWIFRKSENTWPSVRYIVRRGLIAKYKLNFPFSYLHEDIDWTSRIFLHATSFTCSDFYWYNHRMGRQGSITTVESAKRILDVIELVSRIINDKRIMEMEADLRKVVFQRLVSSIYSSLSRYKNMDKQEQLRIRNSLRVNFEVLNYTTALRHRLFLWFTKLFGFKAAFYVMNKIH